MENLQVGDWVVYIHSGEVWEVEGLVDEWVEVKEQLAKMHRQHFRKASDSEVETELERRKWQSFGRMIGEFKVGDIVLFKGELWENDGSLSFFNIGHTEMVCPVEKRVDLT